MKFVLLVCADEFPQTEDDSRPGCDGWDEEMKQRGVLRVGEVLRPPAAATTVRVRGNRVRVSDGPFVETKELIAGFNLIECEDLDEAIEVAAKHPVAAYGMVEVRPVWE